MKRLKFYKKVLGYVKPFWVLLFISFIFRILPPTLSTVNDFMMGKIVDGISRGDFKFAQMFAGLFVVVIASKTLFQRAGNVFSIRKIYSRISNHISRTSLEKSFNLSLGQLKQEHSGFKQDVLRSGSTAIENLNQMIFDESLPLLATVISCVVGLYIIYPPLAYVAVIFFVIYYSVNSYINSIVHEPLKEIIKKRVENNKTFLDIIKNIFWLKFSGQKENTSNHLRKTQRELESATESLWTKYNLIHIGSDLILVSYFAFSAYFTVSLVQSGNVTVGMFVPIMAWIFGVSNAVGDFRMFQRRMMIAQSDIEKMFEMLEQKSDVEIDLNARSVGDFTKNIKFENVSFEYSEGGNKILKNINFEVSRGEKVALVGRSGSGKTTLMSLLLRLYDPKSGSILIDGTDLRHIALHEWHDLIGYVSQEGDIMDVSIKENIMFGARHEASDEEIDFVLDKAGIREFIGSLPDGINTKVGENGVKLSGGQKQRVCIARALIKNSPILLLDEATSSLDSETEHIVNKAVWEMLGDKTGVVIAHRLSTILDADKIIVMDHGEILGIGSHEELLKTTPYYKKLVDAQNISL